MNPKPRLVGKPEKVVRLLDVDKALRGYQEAYDEMVKKYSIVGRPSWFRRVLRKVFRI